VRQAIAYGIDRVALVRQIYGFAPRYPVSDSAIFPTFSRYYSPNWIAYRYRPAQARRLLAQAGCHPGVDGIYVCGEDRLSLRLLTTAGTQFRERAAKLIQTQLLAVGIEVRPSFVPSQSLFGQVLPSGEWDLVLFAYLRDPDPTGQGETVGCGGIDNISVYCQRLVTSAINQADRILDPDVQARVLNDVDAALARDVPLIPLVQSPFVVGFRKTIRNVSISRFNALSTAENWWLER
jgi:peptide/nickel transport system substrate-binding protein